VFDTLRSDPSYLLGRLVSEEVMLSSGPRRSHAGTTSRTRVSSPGLITTSEVPEQSPIAPRPPTGSGWLTLNGVPLTIGGDHVSKVILRNATGISALPEGAQQLLEPPPRETHATPPCMPHNAGELTLSIAAPIHDNTPNKTRSPLSSSSAQAFVPTLDQLILKPAGAAVVSNGTQSHHQPIIQPSTLSKYPNVTPRTILSPSDTRSLVHPHATTTPFTSGNLLQLTSSTSPMNHADSPSMASQLSAPEPHPTLTCIQPMGTPTTGVSSHGMPHLTNEHQRPQQPDDSFHAGFLAPVADDSSAHLKRSFPASPGTDSLNEGHHNNREDLPFGLRNKKMKPTDCLLYAATLLSKDDDSDGHRSSSERMTTPPSSQVGVAMETYTEDLTAPREYDVLCGRGGLINKHVGNVVYRRVVEHNKPFYQSVEKKHRILVSKSIVQSISKFGGRFLILGAKGKAWMEIGYKRAVQKTSQALRERAAAQDEDGEEDDKDMIAEVKDGNEQTSLNTNN
jgi:hypothetical protein